tara:strand:+ start:825 stop:1502 length:678 start_codon:yes stop_codon:yes gene_type:complete
MTPAAHTITMLLADARLPSGGHAFSSGLEPALQGGLAPGDVSAFLRVRGRTTTLVDAATAVVARHVALDMVLSREAPFATVERAWAARTPSRAARHASRELGRGFLRLARNLWPDSPSIGAVESTAPRPIVLGAVAAHVGLDAETLVRLAVYDDMACAVAAMLKLEPGDPIDGVRLVLDACAAVDPFIPQLAALTLPDAIPAASAPQTEAWTEAHAASNRRLFRA